MCNIYFRNNIMGISCKHDGLYYLSVKNDIIPKKEEINIICDFNSYLKCLWHLKLGHIAEDKLARLEKMDMFIPLGT